MKVELLENCTGPNPEYDRDEAERAAVEGRTYDVPREIVIPAGTVIDHPQAHMLCHAGYMNAPPKAQPIDDEAKAKYEVYLQRRESTLRSIQFQLKHPPRNRKARKHLHELAEAYGLDPADERVRESTVLDGSGRPMILNSND